MSEWLFALRLVLWLGLTLSLAPPAGLALAHACGVGARGASLAPALGLALTGALGTPLLFTLPGAAGAAVPWVVAALLLVVTLGLRTHLLSSEPLPPAPARARYPAEQLAGAAIFFLLGLAVVLALRVPLGAHTSRMEVAFAAKVLSSGAWITREAGDLLPGMPESPMAAALAGLMGRAAGGFDERLLALASLSGFLAALWIVWMETRRRPVDGGIFLVALVALLPGQIAEPQAGAAAGGAAPLLAAYYACLLLLVEAPAEEGAGRARFALAALLACAGPFLGPQSWALILPLSALVSVRSGARAAPLWAGSLLILAPLTAVGLAELLSPGIAGKLLPVGARSAGELWHGPAGVLAFLRALFLHPGTASLLGWALLLGLGSAALLPRASGSPWRGAPWLLLAPCLLYVPLCALAPELAGGSDEIQRRLLELAPAGALALHRLMLAAGMGVGREPLLERLVDAPGLTYRGS